MENHPAFSLPDSLKNPDPLLAEKHYTKGLQHYFANQNAKAEEEFKQAITHNGQDARYHYYYGLALLAQNKRAVAKESMRTGSKLEHDNKPGPSTVGASLERVQGSTREFINYYRDRPGKDD